MKEVYYRLAREFWCLNMTSYSECWVVTENIRQKLLVFERKILRRIFGPTQKANGEWRLKTNEELEEAINNENIVRHKIQTTGLIGACRKND